MDKCEELLLDALRCSIHGRTLNWENSDARSRVAFVRLAQSHAVLPMAAQALRSEAPPNEKRVNNILVPTARRMTLTQAARTASSRFSAAISLIQGLQEHNDQLRNQRNRVRRSCKIS